MTTKFTVNLVRGLNREALDKLGETVDGVPTWNGLPFPSNPQPIQSVNGKVGNVVLTPQDIGAAPASHVHSYTHITDWQAGIWNALGLIFEGGEGIELVFDQQNSKIIINADDSAYANINTYIFKQRYFPTTVRHTENFINLQNPNLDNNRIVNAFMETPGGDSEVIIHSYDEPQFFTFDDNHITFINNGAELNTSTLRRRQSLQLTSRQLPSNTQYTEFTQKIHIDHSRLERYDLMVKSEHRAFDYVGGSTFHMNTTVFGTNTSGSQAPYNSYVTSMHIHENNWRRVASNAPQGRSSPINSLPVFSFSSPPRVNHVMFAYRGYSNSNHTDISMQWQDPRRLIDEAYVTMESSVDGSTWTLEGSSEIKKCNLVWDPMEIYNVSERNTFNHILRFNFPENLRAAPFYRFSLRRISDDELFPDTSKVSDVKLLPQQERFMMFKKDGNYYWINENEEFENLGSTISSAKWDQIRKYGMPHYSFKGEFLGSLETMITNNELEVVMLYNSPTISTAMEISWTNYYKRTRPLIITKNEFDSIDQIEVLKSIRRNSVVANGAGVGFLLEKLDDPGTYWYYNFNLNQWVFAPALDDTVLEYGVNNNTNDDVVSIDEANLSLLFDDLAFNDYDIRFHIMLFDNPNHYAARARIQSVSVAGTLPSAWRLCDPNEVIIQLYRRNIGITRATATARPIMVNYQD